MNCYRRDSFGYNFNNERGNNTNDYDKYLKKKEWYERNKDRLKEKHKKYKQNNREKINDMERKKYYFNNYPEEYHSKWVLPEKRGYRIQNPFYYFLREKKIRNTIFNKYKVEIMNKKEMIDAIIKMKPNEYKKTPLNKMKVADVLKVYKKTLSNFLKETNFDYESFERTHYDDDDKDDKDDKNNKDNKDDDDESDNDSHSEDDDYEEQENKVCCAGKEPDCKKCIRAYIFNEEWDKLFNKFNIYFTKITEYKIDDEMEQAVPKDGCWTNYSSNNLSLYGNFNKKKYENADEETFRKEMLMKYNYKYYEAF